MMLKPGWKTTELAIVVAAGALIVLCAAIGWGAAALPLAILAAGYCYARGNAKQGKARFADIRGVYDMLDAHERTERLEHQQKALAQATAEAHEKARKLIEARAEKVGIKLTEGW